MFDLVWCQRHQEGWWPGHGKVLEKQNRPNGAGIHGEIPDSQRADCIKMGVWFSSLQRCRILENISEIGFSPIPLLMLHLGACTSVSMSNVFCGWQRQISRWNLFALVVPFLGKMFLRTVFHHKTPLSITCRQMTLRNPAQD